MKNSVTITIPSHPKYLSIVRTVTARFGEVHNLGDSLIEDFKLAVDEACSNVIKYAYKGDCEREIVVKLGITQKKFEVIIEDDGIKADPESMEGRSLNDVSPGGLGIHLIKRAFDLLEFDEKKKKGNRLRLVKYLNRDCERVLKKPL